jgi:hypothetical protein
MKRFEWDNVNIAITDTQNKKNYWIDITCIDELIDLLNTFNDENEQLKSENDSYKNMFFEIIETALTDKNCRELYCKGILDIFDKANSLNQAREMIKEHLK